MDTLLQDIRFGIRQLKRTPGFAVVVVLTLALGIGANSAIFSVMNAVMLRYLPVKDPQTLVFLHASDQPHRTSQTGYDMASMSYPVYDELRQHHEIFSDLMAFVPLGIPKVAVRIGNEPEEAAADMVSGNFFSGMGVELARGHGFTPADESNHAPVAVLSYSYWTRRFGRNPSVLGQTIFIKGAPFTVVGIAAPGFVGLERGKAVDLWVPLQDSPSLKPWGAPAQDDSTSLKSSPKWWYLMQIGRLAPGVSQAQALAKLQPIFHAAEYIGAGTPEKDEKAPDLEFTPARGIEGVSSDYKQPLLALMAMVGLVLVIACGNVAMLLVARNLSRQREFSLRLALGGSRLRLLRQLLTESLLLVAAGAALGWVFAAWATRALAAWSILQVSLQPDRLVLFFTGGISLLAALAFGLAPLRSASRVPMGMALKTSSANSSQDRGRLRSGQLVVAMQMALCLMLLVAAVLVLRTLRKLEHANLGMNTSGLVIFGVAAPQSARSTPEIVQFYADLMQRLRSLPGVESGTLMEERMGSGWSNNDGAVVDGVNPLGTKFAPLRSNWVGPDFFHVLQTPILMGRDLNDSDTAASPRVAIVNQTFVQKYLPHSSPLGHTIGKKKPFTIVGVVADIKYTEVRENPRPMAWYPYTQSDSPGSMTMELRVHGDPTAILPQAQRVVQDFGPDLPLMEPMTQREQYDLSISQDKLVARLSTFFGILAALLVATGLYGTLAYRVNRRTSEIGVRMALGAQRTQVLWMILRESLLLCAIGAAVGLPLSVAAARLLRSMLFEMSPGDPLSFAAALLGVAAVAMAAGLIPARRASSVDPMIALRYE